MAILESSDGRGGINWLAASLKLWAGMFFPDDEGARTQWLAAAVLSASQGASVSRTDEILTSPEVLRMISSAPGCGELMARAMDGARDGKIAANILWLVLGLAGSEPRHASVRKAIQVMGVQLERGYRHGNGCESLSLTVIKRVWSRFKPVSHFWAAIQYQSSNKHDGYRPLVDFVSTETLLYFLAVAEQIRMLGEGHRPPGGSANSRPLKVSTLDPEKTLKLPADLVLPTVNLKMPTPPRWVLEELRGYRADR